MAREVGSILARPSAKTLRADDRRTAANRETRSTSFGQGWASASNPESAAQARYHESQWARA